MKTKGKLRSAVNSAKAQVSGINFLSLKEIIKAIAGLCIIVLIATSFLAIPVGWGMNIYKLTKCDFEPSYKAEIIRGAGIIIAPVGVVVGYMDIGK